MVVSLYVCVCVYVWVKKIGYVRLDWINHRYHLLRLHAFFWCPELVILLYTQKKKRIETKIRTHSVRFPHRKPVEDVPSSSPSSSSAKSESPSESPSCSSASKSSSLSSLSRSSLYTSANPVDIKIFQSIESPFFTFKSTMAYERPNFRFLSAQNCQITSILFTFIVLIEFFGIIVIFAFWKKWLRKQNSVVIQFSNRIFDNVSLKLKSINRNFCSLKFLLFAAVFFFPIFKSYSNKMLLCVKTYLPFSSFITWYFTQTRMNIHKKKEIYKNQWIKCYLCEEHITVSFNCDHYYYFLFLFFFVFVLKFAKIQCTSYNEQNSRMLRC